MENKKFSRCDFKYNLLAHIIIRHDFQGVSGYECERIIDNVSKLLNEKGFSNRREMYSRDYEFKINDPEKVGDNLATVRSEDRGKIYEFNHVNRFITIQISETAVIVSIEPEKYTNCLDYVELLSKIITQIKSNAVYYRPGRFGIRKINECFIFELDRINDFFEKEIFPIKTYNDNGTRLNVKEIKDSYCSEYYNVNFIRNLTLGQKDNRSCYRAIIDTDIYCYEASLMQDGSILTKTGIDMNGMLFQIYISALTEKFCEQLINGSYNTDVVNGVKKND